MQKKNLDKYPCIPDHVINVVLWYNPLPSLEPHTYAQVEWLSILNQYKFDNVSPNVTFVSKSFNEMFPNLFALSLSKNKINCFDSGVLKNMMNLKIFSVDGNKITKAFIRELPPRLNSIDLKDNNLMSVTFSESFKENMIKMRNGGSTNLFEINLSGNPMVCGCKFREILLILKEAVMFEGSCRYPLPLRGKEFSEVASKCNKTEEDLDIDVDDSFLNDDIVENDDLCDEERQNKQTEDSKSDTSKGSNNESPVRSMKDLIFFGLMMTLVFVN